MESKGGYDSSSGVPKELTPKGIDVGVRSFLVCILEMSSSLSS